MNKTPHKGICVTITMEDYERLVRLAWGSGRTVPGYMRWLLHEHLAALDKELLEKEL